MQIMIAGRIHIDGSIYKDSIFRLGPNKIIPAAGKLVILANIFIKIAGFNRFNQTAIL